MVLENIDVNYFAILIAAIASMIIGGLWYSPILFGNIWIKLSGFTNKEKDKAKQRGMAKFYIIALIGSLVTSFVLAHFVKYMGITSIGGALQLAFWIWVGFIATVMLGTVIWEGKPVKLYLINAVYQLVSFSVAAVILTLWA